MADGPATGQRIVVSGMIAGDPGQGGATWAVMQYVLTLRSLGHEVLVVDALSTVDVAPQVRAYFDELCVAFGLCGRAALLPRSGPPVGIGEAAFSDFVAGATILINLSGRWRDAERWRHIPCRIYVDMDPGFTQLWHAEGGDVGLDGHSHHVTVGSASVGSGECFPTAGVEWRPILPPVHLDSWPVCAAPQAEVLTSVANWRSYGSVLHNDVHFGQKAHSFRQLIGLPRATAKPIDIALSIHAGDDADRQLLLDAGWGLIDPAAAAGTPQRYQRFVQQSWAELGVAKTGYVNGRTGWFSDRSACYLASGRPVVVEDTGLEGVLPLGCGVVAFTGVASAAEAIERIAADYPSHAASARSIAEQHLDGRRILSNLIAWAAG